MMGRMFTARTRTPRGVRRLVAIACGTVALLAWVAGPAAAATNDRFLTGRFTGEHAFDGTITLQFANEAPIGLYLKRYRFRGTLRCEDESIPLDLDHTVTARTSARVRRNGRFELKGATLALQGQYVSGKRVSGRITLKTLPCTRRGGFGASRR
jgi:hypothetical protein